MKTNPDRKDDLFERIRADQCNVCGFTPQELGKEKHRCYYVGHYCSSECYDTLFDYCGLCGKENMTVVTNEKDGKGKICDQCYMDREGLTVVTIVQKFK